MDYIQLTASLCAIIDRQNVIIQAQAMELAQHDALTRETEIRDLRREYAQAMGARHSEGERL